MLEVQLRFWPDPILSQVADPWIFDDPPFDPHELAQAMTVSMQRLGGIGLSGNQIGQPFRVMAMQLQNGLPVCMFNPRLLGTSTDLWPCPEGCLSFPGESVVVPRPKTVQAAWQDAQGLEHCDYFHDIDAKCFLHELDHLNGITMEQRFTSQQLEEIRRRSVPKQQVYFGTDKIIVHHALPGVDMRLIEICLSLHGTVAPSSHMLIGAFSTSEERFNWIMNYLRTWNFPWWLDFNLSNRWLTDIRPSPLLSRFDWSATEQHWHHERTTKRQLDISMSLRLLSRGPRLFFLASYNHGTFRSFVSRVWQRPRVILGHNSAAWLSWRHGQQVDQEEIVLQPQAVIDHLGPNKVFCFDVDSFFHADKFCQQMAGLTQWLNLPPLPSDRLAQIHAEYIKTCERVKQNRTRIKHHSTGGVLVGGALGDQFHINYQHRLEPDIP